MKPGCDAEGGPSNTVTRRPRCLSYKHTKGGKETGYE